MNSEKGNFESECNSFGDAKIGNCQTESASNERKLHGYAGSMSMGDEVEVETAKGIPVNIQTVEGVFRTLALTDEEYAEKKTKEAIPSQEAVVEAKEWVDQNEL